MPRRSSVRLRKRRCAGTTSTGRPCRNVITLDPSSLDTARRWESGVCGRCSGSSATPQHNIVLDCPTDTSLPSDPSQIGRSFVWEDQPEQKRLHADLGYGWGAYVGERDGVWLWDMRQCHDPTSGDRGTAETQEGAMAACGIAAKRHDVATIAGHSRRVARVLGDIRDDGPCDLADRLPYPASWPEGVELRTTH